MGETRYCFNWNDESIWQKRGSSARFSFRHDILLLGSSLDRVSLDFIIDYDIDGEIVPFDVLLKGKDCLIGLEYIGMCDMDTYDHFVLESYRFVLENCEIDDLGLDISVDILLSSMDGDPHEFIIDVQVIPAGGYNTKDRNFVDCYLGG